MQFHKCARCARASTSPYILNTELITMNDVIIIGGSFAGLAAAIEARKAGAKVVVLEKMPCPSQGYGPRHWPAT